MLPNIRFISFLGLKGEPGRSAELTILILLEENLPESSIFMLRIILSVSCFIIPFIVASCLRAAISSGCFSVYFAEYFATSTATLAACVFKSFISDLFFGSLEIIRQCYNCKNKRFYYESFFYITLDANQSMKYGNNPKDSGFIAQSFQKEIMTFFDITRLCPFCQKQINHCEKKKIFLLPINLIIYIKNVENTSIMYPITIDFSFLQTQNEKRNYSLKGVIKKLVKNDKSFFACLYPNTQIGYWILSDGFSFQQFKSPYEHNIGNVVMLFYSSQK